MMNMSDLTPLVEAPAFTFFALAQFIGPVSGTNLSRIVWFSTAASITTAWFSLCYANNYSGASQSEYTLLSRRLNSDSIFSGVSNIIPNGNLRLLIASVNFEVPDEKLWIDGVEVISATPGFAAGLASSGVSLAASLGGLNSDDTSSEQRIVQAGILRQTLDLVTRQKLEGYLAHFGGIAANLPSGHPYKAAAPTLV